MIDPKQGPFPRLASALVKLQRDNAATLTPDPIYSAVDHSRPTIAQRIAKLGIAGEATG